MRERKIYSPRASCGLLILIAAIFALLIGISGLIHFGWESWYFFGVSTVLGSLFIASACYVLCSRVVIDHSGITKTFWFGKVEYRITWEAIERWLMLPCALSTGEAWAKLYAGDPPTITPWLWDDGGSRTALFKVRGKRLPIVVHNYELCRPTFDEFLGEVRAHVGEKEIVIPELKYTLNGSGADPGHSPDRGGI